MNFQGLYHVQKSNYAYAYSDRELHIRLRTAKNDCESVALVIAKKHEWSEKKRFAMGKVASDRYFDYYQYNYITDDPRLGYYFEISDSTETLIYCESGVLKEFDDQYAYFHYFQYPFINPTDVHKVPDWVHGAVFYQIFVERFCNGDRKNDPPKLDKWGALPQPKSFFGGDLRGIINKLDYLYDFGINGIYLTPIFESPSNHKYDTTDYRKIDESFGDTKILKELVTKAHKKGIRVILDGVFNHSGFYFAPFQDVLKNGKDSPYSEWFHIKDFPVTREPLSYRVFGTSPQMPKLNTSNAELKKYLIDSAAYWTKVTGIDGWRLDVSDEVDHHFWRDFRKTIKSINKDAVIIGENWHNAYPWLMGDQFDSVMNYPVTKSCIQFFATGEIDAQTFSADISGHLMWYSEQVNFAMLNLLDSHDTMRFLTWCKGDKRKLKLAVMFLFSYIGIPCVYYGSEIGMEGGGDPDCRRTFDWNEEDWDKDLRGFYKNIIKIRKSQKSLQYGNIKMSVQDEILYVKRSYNGETVLTVINNTENTKTADAACTCAANLLSTEPDAACTEQNALLPPFSGKILAIK